MEIAERLDAMGVDVVEAGFPVNSAAEAAAVQQVAFAVQRARVCALARAVPKDIAAAATPCATRPVRASTSSSMPATCIWPTS